MPVRSSTDVDVELSKAVKARDAARSTISELSGVIVSLTQRIDKLLAERSAASQVPDSPASLTTEAS
jgi:hypothetical protein